MKTISICNFIVTYVNLAAIKIYTNSLIEKVNTMNAKKSTVAIALSAIFALSACGGGGGSSKTPDTDTTPTNSAPTDISVSNTSVDENTAGAVVGTLSATDASGDTHTFSVDGDMFVVNGTELALAEGVEANYEAAQSYTINVTAQDNGGLSFTKEMTIEVNNIAGYDFESKFEEGSSVSYSGQIARHALINELNHYIANELKTDLDNGVLATKQDVLDKLNLYFRTTEGQYDNFALKSFGDNAKQKFIANISGSAKRLGGEGGKIAGRDEKGQHKTWGHTDSASNAFIGWGNQGDYTPEGLVDMFFEQLADNAMTYINGAARFDVNGEAITSIYVNEDGTDLKQLIQKFLLMSVTYSQAADDYFGHETEGKGLLTDNTSAVSGKKYTNLEHQFDEGFGYFGAARDYLEYSDNEIAGKVDDEGTNGRTAWNGKFDSNADGEIDLLSEYNFGASVNAAKRDRKAVVATDFTGDAMNALIAGRKLINDNAPNALTDEQMETLKGHRDQALLAWEKAIAATVVHYINDSYADLNKLKEGSTEFSFTDLAKHWSELKGFALGLQFNPYSPLSDEDFALFHQYVGDKPVVDMADIEAYQNNLIKARDIFKEAYEFDAENAENW